VGEPASSVSEPKRNLHSLSAAHVGLALLLNAGILPLSGPQRALECLTGDLVEKSLSVGNIVAIMLLFAQVAIPTAYRHRVLFCGAPPHGVGCGRLNRWPNERSDIQHMTWERFDDRRR
jgi:hypothetical protein